MTNNRSLSLVLSFFGDGLGQWLIHRSPNAQDWGKSTFRSTPWLATIACIAMVGLCAMGWYYLQFWFTVALLSALTIGAMYVAERDHSGIWQFLVEMFRPQRDDREPIQKPDGQPVAPAKYEPPSRIGHVADGGFYDYLGVSELFRRKCSLIVVSDAGAHLGDNTLGTLAKMCSHATAEFGVRILDLDHESPIDFGRLEFDQAHENERVVHQPYLVARIRYADDTPGLLVYCQMAITHSDPIEIQQIRNRFPSFPDEPTTNQFYTDDQVAAYRNLGYHIAKRMGSELHRWTAEDLAAFSKPNDRESARCPVAPPLFEVVERRILTAYRLACYQEHSYKSNDLFSEAIWSTKSYECPSFSRTVDSDLIGPECELPMNGQPSGSELSLRTRAENWLRAYEKNGDLRAKYRYAVLGDINSIEDEVTSDAASIYREILQQARQAAERAADERPLSASFERELMAAHLTVIAVACHEIHEGRPNAIFQVGGRKKLLAMTTELAKVLVPVEAEEEIDEGPTDFHPPTRRRCGRPSNAALARSWNSKSVPSKVLNA